MIPKVIHYCWFSDEPYPVEIKKCMDTWRKILPDFTLRLWTLEDALAINCDYINEALQCKKWAFAADVVRLYALYSEGGVYMDSDIFLKKRFDEFLNVGDFITFHECPVDSYQKEAVRIEGKEVPFGLQAAFMIGEKGNLFCKLVLDYYSKLHFLNEDGLIVMRVAPFTYAEVAETIGFKYINEKQVLSGNTIIYESKYFALSKRDLSPQTFGVHRISHSWKDLSDYSFSRRTEKRIKHCFRVLRYNLFKR